METREERANIIDEKLQDLNKTLQQLQKSLPIIESSNAALNPTFEPKPKTDENAILSRSDTLKILSQLKSIKKNIIEYETSRTKDKEYLLNVRNSMKNELLEIKKELLVNNLREVPKEFRIYLEKQLLELKEELIKFKNNSNNSHNSNNNELLEKIKSELIGIRNEMCLKLKELEEYKKFEKEFKLYRERLNIKVLKIKLEVEKYESELIETKKELNNYKSGNKIPILLQNTIISKLCLLKEQIFRIETENKTYRMQLETENEKHNYFNLCSMIKNTLYVTCVDMHIGGEPLRIVVNGIPSLSKGKTLLDKRQLMIKNFDYYRKFLMHEPRGHFDMYGVIITECDAFGKKNNAHFAVLFMNNEGYSSMCGHGIIGITRYAIDYGLVKNNNNNNNNNNTIRIQCPCGIVESTINNKNEISFISTPGWAEYISTSIQLDQFGKIEIDIGYGGSYYVICPSTRFNLNVCDSPIDDIISISTLIKQTVIKKLSLSNPDSKDLEFLHGIILTDGINASNESSLNICVFADRQVDRSPTGSGIIARLAVDYAKKNIKIGQKRKFVGKTGSILSGEIVKVLQNYKNKKNAVIVKVTGTAKYIATSQFYLEDGDELGRGFLIS